MSEQEEATRRRHAALAFALDASGRMVIDGVDQLIEAARKIEKYLKGETDGR